MSMARAIREPVERSIAYGQVVLDLVDDFTGDKPLGKLALQLDVRDVDGVTWRETDIQPTVNSRGILFYPKLGFRARIDDPDDGTEYRVRVRAEYYRPFYRRHVDGLEFVVSPYNNEQPLDEDKVVKSPRVDPDYRALLPAVNYPYPSHVQVIRGAVVEAPDSGGPVALAQLVPVVDAQVEFGLHKGVVLTDERGFFSLPIRWLASKTTLVAQLSDTQLKVNLVEGLSSYGTIRIAVDPAIQVDLSQVEVNEATAVLTLKTAVTDAIPANTQIQLVKFDVHVQDFRNGRERKFAVSLTEAFRKNQMITLPPVSP